MSFDLNISISKENSLNQVICSLHPHKQNQADLRVKSFIIRKGWGALKELLRRESK